jgi:hypothetical protein
MKQMSKRILNKYNGRLTRPLSIAELEIILSRFEIMLEEEEDEYKYSILEFIEQEDFRRELFPLSDLVTEK